MRNFTAAAAMALVFSTIAAIPITPSAPALQRRAEMYRLEGLKEQEIAARFTSPEDTDSPAPASAPFLSRMNTHFHSLFSSPSNEDDGDDDTHDFSGDIAPGSLEAPQMLPSAAAPDSLADSLYEQIHALFHAEDAERRNFGYEGKELELRRPEGMRFWGS